MQTVQVGANRSARQEAARDSAVGEPGNGINEVECEGSLLPSEPEEGNKANHVAEYMDKAMPPEEDAEKLERKNAPDYQQKTDRRVPEPLRDDPARRHVRDLAS